MSACGLGNALVEVVVMCLGGGPSCARVMAVRVSMVRTHGSIGVLAFAMVVSVARMVKY